jgi:hypothetical protein
VKVYEAKTLIDSMEARSQTYNELREKLEQLKRKCNDVVNLDDRLKGKGADAIKGFYQAQIDVIEAWLRLVDRNIAFFNGIAGTAEDVDLSGDTVVHVPFLVDELKHHKRSHNRMNFKRFSTGLMTLYLLMSSQRPGLMTISKKQSRAEEAQQKRSIN